MIVTDMPLPETPIDALVATDTDEVAGVHEREIVGYRCEECGAADETLMQLIHEAECPLHGEHGRQFYDDGELPVVEAPTPEFKQHHPIDIIEAGWTDSSEGVHNGEPIMFRCGECGNADETLLEIRHDEDCSLAGRYGATQARVVATDGRGD